MPERRRNARRSIPGFCSASAALSEARRAWRSVLLISTGASSLRIAVDAIEGPHVIALLLSRLALLIVGLGIGFRLGRKRRGGRSRCADSQHAKELTTA